MNPNNTPMSTRHVMLGAHAGAKCQPGGFSRPRGEKRNGRKSSSAEVRVAAMQWLDNRGVSQFSNVFVSTAAATVGKQRATIAANPSP